MKHGVVWHVWFRYACMEETTYLFRFRHRVSRAQRHNKEHRGAPSSPEEPSGARNVHLTYPGTRGRGNLSEAVDRIWHVLFIFDHVGVALK